MASTHDLTGTVVLVTGGTRGLGRAMTSALVDSGASVFVVASDPDGIEQLVNLGDSHLTGSAADVSVEAEVKEAVERCLAEFGRLDVVVNNAGIGMTELRPDWPERPHRFWELDDRDLHRFFDVDALAPVLVAKAALPSMLGKGWGRLITVTTSLDTMTRGGQAPYGPAKAASEAFASVMAHDLLGSGVTSNVLIPGGAADTGMVPASMRNADARLLEPVIMGPPVVWLSSRASDALTAMRVTASRWDPSVSEDEAVSRAVRPIAWPSDRTIT